jgi:hypothetical protein
MYYIINNIIKKDKYAKYINKKKNSFSKHNISEYCISWLFFKKKSNLQII